MHWLHHVIFDPLSWWEQTKITLAFTAITVAFILCWVGFWGRHSNG